MFNIIKQWFQRFFSEPEAVILLFSLIFLFLVIIYMGNMLAPAFVSLVLAYLLQSIVRLLERCKIPHSLAVIIVFLVFISLVLLLLLGILPLLWRQVSNFINEIPSMLNRLQAMLMHLPKKYPDYITVTQVEHVIAESKTQMAHLGQLIFSYSLNSIPGIIQVVIYLVLVPLLIYFYLMDKKILMNWFRQFMPRDRRLILQVWREVNEQISNYVSGKIMETIIIGFITYIAFLLMHLQYALLLGALVGISVIIPYIGAILVTVPVVIIALIQWGWTSQFFYLILVYAIIVTIDANILVPVLFSEVMNLHPVAIIIAILVFGGIWGFWGIFFAIPLATVVKAVITAWPKGQHDVKISNEEAHN